MQSQTNQEAITLHHDQTSKVEKNMKQAQEAIGHVRKFLEFATNAKKDAHLLKGSSFFSSAMKVAEQRKYVTDECEQYRCLNPKATDFLPFFRITYAALERYHCGNCGVQARAAFHYLYISDVYPLDLCETTLGKHELVVIGRRNDSIPDDITTWGEEAVVCDPWAEKYYPLVSFLDLQKPEHNIEYADELKSFPMPPYLSGQLVSRYRYEKPNESSMQSAALTRSSTI